MKTAHWIIVAALSALLAVALGAFGAHALEAQLSKLGLTEVWQTANRYHFYHSFGILAIGWLSDRYQQSKWTWVGLSFLTGIIFFSGSLYAMGLSGVRTLGAITPIGGVFFMIGWGLLAYKVWKAAKA